MEDHSWNGHNLKLSKKLWREKITLLNGFMKSWEDLNIMEGFPVMFVEVIKCEEVVNLISNACLALIYG